MRLLPFTRGVYIAGVCLTAGTGIGLYLAPRRTADYWAWTIKAPLTAAFFGAGYIGAALSLALGAREHTWERTRTVALAALTLTALALLATLRHLGALAFGQGGLPEVVAWIWLAVYVAIPPLLLAAFVLQTREPGGTPPEHAALGATRLALGAAGVVLGVLGLGLFAEWSTLTTRWPWPLPPLPSAVLGAWFCTYAVAFLWFAVRERDWRRVRIGVLPALVSFSLDLIAVARFHDDLHANARTIVYVALLATVTLIVAIAATVEERRLRG